MRNLKRALSLTLASVMLLGMMVIGTSAASYPDVTEEHNVEAIEVLQAVGVMSGSDTGNFNPDSLVSRIEMAIVMSNLMNLKVDYFEGQCKFTDVPAWAGKYVAACEANGIVSGVGGGRYGTGNVTATQAALMMLKALGYFQYASDFEGGWDRNTARLAADLRLFSGMDVQNNTELTRNQVAQLALNTLKTPVVVADDNTLHITTTVGGADTTVTSGKVTYKVTASSDAYARAISAVEGSDQTTVNGISGWVIELGEKLYNGKLQLRENGKDNASVYDDFGRPARRWQYDGTTFGTYPKKEELRQEYTKKVTGKMLYDELGADLIKQYSFNITIDGETERNILNQDHNSDGSDETDYYFTTNSITRNNTWAVGGTGNGVLTQVYVDSVEHEVNIAIINTYLAKATQDYNSKDNDVDLTVYKLGNHGSALNPHYVKCDYDDASGYTDAKLTVKGEDFAIEDVKEDDFFLVQVADGEIQVMAKPEIVSETTLNSFKKTDWVKNDDAQYDYASTARYDVEVLDNYDQSNMQSVTYDVILDQYGYLVGIELNEELNQYLFLTGMDLGNSNLSAKNATANVIFLDGTMSTVTVDVEKSEKATSPDGKNYTVTGGADDFDDITAGDGWSQVNTWCTYTVDANGVYTLKQVGNRSNARVDGVNGAKKIAQSVMSVANNGGSTANTYTSVPLDSSKLEISGKQVRLNGSKARNSTYGDFDFVYGNDETVYINASLKKVTAKSGTTTRAIVDKVDSVTTGVKNVDITVKDLHNSTGGANPDALNGSWLPGAAAADDNQGNEVYALYKDNGYLIGVVTLDAEDNGTSNSYAYIIGTVKQEDLIGNNQWRWSKEAIINGKLVTLTEINNTYKNLGDNQTVKGQWYSLRFDKDGNVSSIKQETSTDAINFAVDNDKFVENVQNVYPATIGAGGVDGETFTSRNDTVVLKADYRCGVGGHAGPGKREMKFEAGTLYTDRKANNVGGDGFQIDPNANIVVLLSETHGDSKAYNTKTDGFVGWDGMEQAIKELQSETSNGWSDFDGILYAVFNKGIATSVILDSRSGKGNQKPGEPVVTMSLTITNVDKATGATIGTETIDWDGTALSGRTLTGYTYDSDTNPTFREGRSGSCTIYWNKDAVKSNIIVQFQLGGGDVGSQKVVAVALNDGVNLLSHKNADVIAALAADATLANAYEITSNGSEIVSKNQTTEVNIPVTLKQPKAVADKDAFVALPAIDPVDDAPIADYISYGVTAEIGTTTTPTVTLKGQVKNLKTNADDQAFKDALHVYSPSQTWDKATWEALYDIGQNPTTHMSPAGDTSTDKAYGFVTVSVNNFTRVLLVVQDGSNAWHFIQRADAGGAVTRPTTVNLAFNGVTYTIGFDASLGVAAP